MFWHIDTDIVCLLFMIVLCVSAKTQMKTGQKNRGSFISCVYIALVTLTADIVASIAMEYPVPRWFYQFFMTLYFAVLMLGIIVWADYTIGIVYPEKTRERKLYHILFTAPYVVYLAVIILNLWTGWVYSLGEGNAYARGPLFSLVYIYYLSYAFCLLLFILSKWKAIAKLYLRLLLLGLPLLLGLGILVQLTNPGWLMIVPFYSVALFISYLFIQNDDTKSILAFKQDEIQRVSILASTDEMTGLFNHSATFDKIGQYLQHDGEGKRHALFMIDLDNFKQINDRLGHQAGDEILISAAERIKKSFRDSDVVGRIGGDEFLILMRNVDADAIIRKKAGELMELLQFDCGAYGQSLGVTVSMGVGIFEKGKSWDQLYKETDKALYDAKSTGKNRYAFYEDAEGGAIRAEPFMTVHLRTILENMDGGILLANVGEEVLISYVSPSYYKTLVPKGEKLGTDPEEVKRQVYPPDLEGVLNCCKRAALSGEVSECVYRVGKFAERWDLLRVARLTGGDAEDGIPIICVITNITQLKKSEIMLDAILKTSPTGIGIYELSDDCALKPIYLNEGGLLASDLNRALYADAFARDATIAIHPEDLPAIREKLREIQKGTPFDLNYRNNPATCVRPKSISARCTVIGTQNGHPLLLLVFADMTSGGLKT